jgi:hypothetical protein
VGRTIEAYLTILAKAILMGESAYLMMGANTFSRHQNIAFFEPTSALRVVRVVAGSLLRSGMYKFADKT